MNKYAVVIGVGRTDPGDNAGSDNDANLFTRLLKRDYGFDGKNIVTLINNKAKKADVLQATSDMVLKATEADEVVFFISTHGYINIVQLTDGFLNVSELQGIFSTLKSKKVFICVCACYSGSFVAPLAGIGRFVQSSVGMTVAFDGQHYTFFGRMFLDEAINKKKGDANKDGIVSINEASAYAQQGWVSNQYDGEMIL